MHTPKKKKSQDGFYAQSQYEDGPSQFDSCGYSCPTQANADDAALFNRGDKRPIVSNALINLNVGGTAYTTTLATLAKDPNSTLYKFAFCALNGLECADGEADFSGYFNCGNAGGAASIFVDRDGKTFQYVLNYLRDGDLICPDDPFVHQSILADARFFRLDKLAELVRAKTDRTPERVPSQAEPPREVEVLSIKSQLTPIECGESVQLTHLAGPEFFLPQNNVFIHIEENVGADHAQDNIEDSGHFVQTTPVRLLGKQEFSTTADF